MENCQQYLARQKTTENNELADEWDEISQLYYRKLWHQLTLKLQKFINHDYFKNGTFLLELYERFIMEFELKINPLSLAEILLTISKAMEDEESIKFIEKSMEKVKQSKDGRILCMVAIGKLYLNLGNISEVKSMMVEAGAQLDSLNGVTKAHAPYYDLCIMFYKQIGDHNRYYGDALRFLGCVDLNDLPLPDQMERAYHLSLAALLGDQVYNFGELLIHPVLDSLRDTEKQWLIDLLSVFNSGNIRGFLELKDHWCSQPDLRENEGNLLQKIQLLALMELTFKRPANERTLKFDDVAECTMISSGEVEKLLMKALSLKLLKGFIDEVCQEVNMTWVQPRVLDHVQVTGMQTRMTDWCTCVEKTVSSVSSHAQELITAKGPLQ